MTRSTIIADPGSCWRASPDEPQTAAWDRARRLIAYAKAAGADVCKFQWLRESIYPDGSAAQSLIRPYCLPEEWLPRLRDACREEGIQFACTCYRPEDVPLVDTLGVPFHKVASFEHNHGALLRVCLLTRRTTLVSLGTARRDGIALQETWDALAAAWPNCPRWHRACLVFLVCVSAYPAAPAEYDLRCLRRSRSNRWPEGVSDHTPGSCHAVGAAAAALGAQYIEKHLRAPDSGTSPDAHFAALPDDFAAYVRLIREVERTLADAPRDLSNEWRWARWNPQTGRRGTPPVSTGQEEDSR